VAATLIELGAVRRDWGDHVEAGRLLRQAIVILEKHEERSELAHALDGLSIERSLARDDAGAEQLVRRSIAINEHLFGPDHPRVASGLTRLAWILSAADREGAERAARRALSIQERRLGSGHPATLSTKSQLSLIIKDRGDLVTAERMQHEVLEGRLRALGEYHRDVAGSLANLSAMSRLRGDLAGGEEMLRRSVDVYRKVASGDIDYGRTVLELAMLRHHRGDDRGAANLAREVLGFTVEGLVEMAPVLAAQGDCKAAQTFSNGLRQSTPESPAANTPFHARGNRRARASPLAGSNLRNLPRVSQTLCDTAQCRRQDGINGVSRRVGRRIARRVPFPSARRSSPQQRQLDE